MVGPRTFRPAPCMSRAITVTVGDIAMDAVLLDTPTADAIWDALPIARTVNTWGNEFYFDIGVQADQEPDASDVVEVGDLAYWPPGLAFCVFFGRTPASRGTEVRAASPVNVVLSPLVLNLAKRSPAQAM